MAEITHARIEKMPILDQVRTSNKLCRIEARTSDEETRPNVRRKEFLSEM
jgi:hypothetical protein